MDRKNFRYKKRGNGSRFVAVMLVGSMLLTSLNAETFSTFAATPDPVSWDIGKETDTVSAELEDGTLTVSGYGDVQDFTADTVPFAGYADEIHTLVIEDGVTSLGDYLFYNLGKLEGNLTLPAGLLRIGDYTFSGEDYEHAPKFTTVINEFTDAEVIAIATPGDADEVEKATPGDADAAEPATASDAKEADGSAKDREIPRATPSDVSWRRIDNNQILSEDGELDEDGEPTGRMYRVETITEQDTGEAVFFAGQEGVYACQEENYGFADAAEAAGYKKCESFVTAVLSPGRGQIDESHLSSENSGDGTVALMLPVYHDRVILPALPRCFAGPEMEGFVTSVFAGWSPEPDGDAEAALLLPGEMMPGEADGTVSLWAAWKEQPVPLIASQTAVVMEEGIFRFTVGATELNGYIIDYQWQESRDYAEAGENAVWTDLDGETGPEYLRAWEAGGEHLFIRCTVTAVKEQAAFSLFRDAELPLSETSEPVAATSPLTVTYYSAEEPDATTYIKEYEAGATALALYPASLGMTVPNGQVFSHWVTSDSSTAYNAGEVINTSETELSLYAVWKTADTTLSAVLSGKSGSTNGQVTLDENGGTVVTDWDYAGDIRILHITTANVLNQQYTITVDIPVGMAIHKDSYTKANETTITSVDLDENDYSVVTSDSNIQEKLKKGLTAIDGTSADLTYTVKAGAKADITVNLIYDTVLWDKLKGSSVTGDAPAISVTLEQQGTAKVTKTLAGVKAKQNFGGGPGDSPYYIATGAFSSGATEGEKALNGICVISQDQSKGDNFWKKLVVKISPVVTRNGSLVSVTNSNLRYTGDQLGQSGEPGESGTVTYECSDVCKGFLESFVQPKYNYIASKTAGDGGLLEGDVIKFNCTLTLDSWTGKPNEINATFGEQIFTKIPAVGLVTDYVASQIFMPHNITGTVGYLGRLQMTNNGATAGTTEITMEFDTENEWNQRIYSLRLLTAQSPLTINYELVDDNETHDITSGTKVLTQSNLGVNQGIPFTIKTLGADTNGKSIKKISYTLDSLPATTDFYMQSAIRSTSSAGTLWGTIAPGGEATNKLTVTLLDAEETAKKTLAQEQTVTGLNSTVSVPAYLPNVMINGKKQSAEIEAGNKAEISVEMNTCPYPYENTTGYVVQEPVLFFLAPKGILLENAVTTGGTDNYVTKYEADRVLTDGRTVYKISLEKPFGGWTYNQGGTALLPNQKVNLTVSAEPGMESGAFALKDSLFIGQIGLECGNMGGSYASYKYPDTHMLVTDNPNKYIGGLISSTAMILTVKPAQNALEVTADAKLAEEDTPAYRSGEENPISLTDVEQQMDYRLHIKNISSGWVTKDAFYYYVPIPGAGADATEMIQGTPGFSMKLTGPVAITGNNPQLYDVRYSTDADASNYDNGKADFGTDGDGKAAYHTAAEMADLNLNWADVKMIKIVPSSHIPAGTDDQFLFRLAYGDTEAEFIKRAGNTAVWRSNGYQSYGGADVKSARTPTAYVAAELKYRGSGDVTLTAFTGSQEAGDSKTAQIKLPAFAEVKNLHISKVETENVELVDTILEENRTGWSSSQANNTFSIRVGAPGASDSIPLQKGSGLELGSWSTAVDTAFPLEFTIDHANALSDASTSRKVTVTLTDGAGVEYTVTVTVKIKPAAITAPATMVDVGGFYGLIGGSATSLTVTANSKITAQFVLPNMLPANYSGHTISWDGGGFPKGTTITMVDVTEDTPGYYYYKAGEAAGAVSLGSFIKMGTTDTHYQDRATGGGSLPGATITEKLVFVVDFEKAEALAAGEHTLALKVAGTSGTEDVNPSLAVKIVSTTTFGLTAAVSEETVTDTITLSGSVTPSILSDTSTSHQHQKLALVISVDETAKGAAGAGFPKGSLITYQGEEYHLSDGRFVIPLGTLGELRKASSFAMTLKTPYETLATGAHTVTADLYISATANGSKPYGGERLATQICPITVGKKTVYELNVTGEKQILEPGDTEIPVQIQYSDSAKAGGNAYVAFSVQKKDGSSYLTQTDLLVSVVTDGETITPGNDGIIGVPGFKGNGAEDVTVNLDKDKLKPGTYRLMFRVSGKGDAIEVPYNFIVAGDTGV